MTVATVSLSPKILLIESAAQSKNTSINCYSVLRNCRTRTRRAAPVADPEAASPRPPATHPQRHALARHATAPLGALPPPRRVKLHHPILPHLTSPHGLLRSPHPSTPSRPHLPSASPSPSSLSSVPVPVPAYRLRVRVLPPVPTTHPEPNW
jgi:hypothetical protein